MRPTYANRILAGRDPWGMREHAERSIASSPRSNQEASKSQPGGVATAYAQRSRCAASAALKASHTCAQRGRLGEISAKSGERGEVELDRREYCAMKRVGETGPTMEYWDGAHL